MIPGTCRRPDPARQKSYAAATSPIASASSIIAIFVGWGFEVELFAAFDGFSLLFLFLTISMALRTGADHVVWSGFALKN
jgi:hypothetical protein